MAAFFSAGDATDRNYIGLRDEPDSELRGRIEEMWRQYDPYCPDAHAHFLADARCNFVARTWEMYVACTLLNAGFSLDRPPAKGPDIKTSANGTRLWIEAVAPDSGSGADAVLDRDRRGRRKGNQWFGHGPSEESLILRCTSALDAKRTKLAEYTDAQIVAPSDACVIALTLGGVPDSDMASPDLPIIVKSVFGVGPAYVAVFVDGSGMIEKGFKERPEVTKKSGAAVQSTFFHDEDSSGISGVLFSKTAIWNAPKILGRDLIFVHNPSASVPLPLGGFPFADEYFVDGDNKLDIKQRTELAPGSA